MNRSGIILGCAEIKKEGAGQCCFQLDIHNVFFIYSTSTCLFSECRNQIRLDITL